MAKYMTLKEIHRFLIEKDLLHSSQSYQNNKKILNKMLEEDNYKEISPALFEEGEICPSEREL